MRKNFLSFTITTLIGIMQLCVVSNLNAQTACPEDAIQGQVFLDSDLDGTRDNEELGIGNILVQAFGADGLLYGESITASDGTYSIDELIPDEGYRIVFDFPESYLVSYIGPDNSTAIQFVRAQTCNASLGLSTSTLSCGSNPDVFLNCFVRGDANSNLDGSTIVGVEYGFNPSSAPFMIATKAETGSVWGLAYSPKRELIYSSAFVKQYASLTEHGHDAIFVTDPLTRSTSLFTKLQDLGSNVGNLGFTDPMACDYGSQAGKIGLGAMEISQDESILYVANLFDNTIVKIDIENPSEESTRIVNVPDPGCNNGDYRVFALKQFAGKLYVGITCTEESAETPNEDNVAAHIYEMDLSDDSFKLIFSTNVLKGVWSDAPANSLETVHWLTDIEFTEDRNMILAISDRIGHRYCDEQNGRLDLLNGDILMVYNDNGSYRLESNGSIGSGQSLVFGSGVDNGQGPGGGEFFGDDFFPGNPSLHPDVAVGSLYLGPNRDDIIAAVYDPLNNTYSGGLHRYDTRNGAKISSIELYSRNIDINFGKAVGFGDIVGRCGARPIEIGNNAWCDDNANGLQDVGEMGFANIVLNVYNANCEQVGSTVTSSSGLFAVNNKNIDVNFDGISDGLISDEDYYLMIDDQYFDADNCLYNFGGVDMIPTIINFEDDKINSNLEKQESVCPDLLRLGAVKINESSNNHSLDFGLMKVGDFDLNLIKNTVSDGDYQVGDIVTFQIDVVNEGSMIAKEVSIIDYINTNYSFDQNLNPGWRYDGQNAKYKFDEMFCPGEKISAQINLIVTGGDRDGYLNLAEISGAIDQYGNPADDIDSVYDEDPNNDVIGTPSIPFNPIDSDPLSNDEDDHDDENIDIFDLALIKVIRESRAYISCENVTFDIRVCNQGTVAANYVQIAESLNNDLVFLPNLNPDWTLIPGSRLTREYNGLISPGQCMTFPITYKIAENTLSDCIINYSEITAATSEIDGLHDFDSTPDFDFENDNGGNIDDGTDNMDDSSDGTDEDDHDPVVVKTSYFDLALQKVSIQDRVNPGDVIEFEISIHNQGEISAYNVEIVDYVPNGTRVVDPNWVVDPNNPDIYIRNLPFDDGFAPGDIFTTTIALQVEDFVNSHYITNYAEILSAEDASGRLLSDLDIDSQADANVNNDTGGNISNFTDNEIMDDGMIDEDDHDPAAVFARAPATVSDCMCLNNATSIDDGQFSETITVSAPSGETWYIDFVDGLYSSMSPAPPANPVAFTTGAMGMILSENVLGGGVSDYTLQGIYSNSQFYSIRLTNGTGDFAQISNGGGCTYDLPGATDIIEGPGAVCGMSTERYSVVAEPGCTYTWSLNGGGTFTSGNIGATVSVDWGAVTGGPYELTVVQNCGNVDPCDAPLTKNIFIGQSIGALICVHDLNISLDSDCSVEVTPAMVLVSEINPNAAYEVMVMDPHGDPIPGNTVTDEHIGMQLMVKVIDACSGNSCWGNITIEDKFAPVLNCGDIELSCNEMNSYVPLAIDNCSQDITITMINEQINTLNCDPDYIKEVVRTYIAEDEYGNVSDECVQTIRLERVDFDEIDYPDDFEIADGTALNCDEVIFNDEGTPDVSQTGVPTIDGNPIYPIGDLYCNIAVDYRDVVINDTGCNRKYMRTWLVYEAWCSVGRIDTVVQVIEIEDREDPEIVCPEDITMSTENIGCSVDIALPLPTVTDDCSTLFEIDVAYDGGFIDNITTNEIITVEAGTTVLTYTAYDECGNSDQCVVNVFVDDLNPPVAVCDEFSAIALRSDGSAEAFASIFDDGSYDDCNLRKFLVRRMDNGDCPCDIPSYNDHDYLGEYNGHYYYLSHAFVPAQKAIKLSAAHGGYLVNIETMGEHQFIYDAVNAISSDEYYIGLNDVANEGSFKWSNGTYPTYFNWTPGSPTGAGDYVIVENSGTWTDVMGTSRMERYVMEVSDPCGFSDYVSFCCEDVSTDPDDYPTIVFRAIDYFGNYNQCMVSAEIQDKTPPTITCPSDRTVECGDFIDINNLSSQFGMATATDACTVRIEVDSTININSCGVGTITRTFTASDNNGSTTCTQTIDVINTDPFDPRTIVFPADTTLTESCSDGDLAPENLNGEPSYIEDGCDMVAATYSDEVFLFAGNSNACFKILRTWVVIDWCQMDNNPSYQPTTHEQTIKINNDVAPIFTSGCESDTLFTLECESEVFTFIAEATDDCTPNESLAQSYNIDFDSDGINDIEGPIENGNVISVTADWPLGCHLIYYTFEDRCGNKTTCAKEVCVINDKSPTAACIFGLAIALEPTDTDGDGIPDNEMACLFAETVNASSTPACPGDSLTFSFSADTSDTKMLFDCFDIGVNTITLWVTDQDGDTDICITTIEVQDNNIFDFCPSFDLALRKTVNSSTTGPFQSGELVTFDIEIFNQGDFDAFDVEVVDYIPQGLTLVDGSWTAQSGQATYNLPIDIASGDSLTISIEFRINDGFTGSIMNAAEITNADDDNDPNNNPPNDDDSNPDNDPDNDGTPINDEINDPINDEDDHDIEVIQVFDFDLALQKTLVGTGPFENGDDVTFNIRVFNQGSLEATNVVITDYIPTGFNFNQIDNTDFVNNGSAVTATLATLNPFSSVDLTITLEIDDDFIGSSLTNNAEITSATNAQGFEDADDPLSNTNDGSNPELATNDDINDNPDNPNDEDDYDPEQIDVLCTVAPTCSVVSTLKLELDANGMATLTESMIDAGSSAACNSNPVIFTISRTSFDCDDVGAPITISVSVTDDLGNVSTNDCEVEVTVCDVTPPTLTCQDVNTGFDNNGMLILDIPDVVVASDDNCSIATTEFDLTSVDFEDLMDCIAQTGQVVVTDIAGNSTTCSFEITIEDDVNPVCVPNDTILTVSGPNQIITIDSTFVAAGSFDECSGIATIDVTPNTFDCSFAGTTTVVTITVTDNSGNTSQCTAEVTVVDDAVPMCIVQDITVSINANGSIIVDPNLIDNGSTGGCDGMVNFSVSPNTFFCNDKGDNLVTFTATANGGASCSAVATVTIRDTIPPTIGCPLDMTLSCGTDISDLSVFGTPTALDNCQATLVVTEDVVSNLNVCDVGVITRTFTATDCSGNSTTCQQILTIEAGVDPLTAADITFPPSPFIVSDCAMSTDISMLSTGMPTLTGMFDCAITSIDFVDVDLDPSNMNFCNKDYERIWTVVDSCQLDGMGAGVFTFTQSVLLRDTIAPFFDFVPADVQIDLPEPDCESVVQLLPATANDTCGVMSSIVITNDSPYATNNNSSNASGTYPAGLTIVTFFAEDICGNVATAQVMVSVVDTVVSGFNCNKQILQLPDSLTLPVLASDYQTTIDSSSMCGGLSTTISYSDNDPFDTLRIVGCPDLGITNPVIYLWSAGTLIDSCVAELMLSNPTGGCPEPPSINDANIFGVISTESNEPIADVEVDLEGSGMPFIVTNDDGNYAFPVMPLGGNYVIAAEKDNDHMNGVSTLDLISIQQHILGLRKLDSPYKMIAADVDRSGSISSIDVLELRKLILGIYPTFPNNTSWRMIDAGFSFPDHNNPFVTAFPEDYNIYELGSDMEVDFVGVKVGDVNESARANFSSPDLEKRNSEIVYLLADEERVEHGIVEIPVRASDIKSLVGMQFTLDVDPYVASIVALIPNANHMDETNFNINQINNGLISCSWDKNIDAKDDDELFKLVVRVNHTSWVSEIFELNSLITTKEAYTNGAIHNLEIRFEKDDIEEAVILYQNTPNPWIDYTTISFYSDEERDMKINIFDVNGKLLYTKELQANSGNNDLQISKSELSGSGVMYYELIYEDKQFMKKMITIN